MTLDDILAQFDRLGLTEGEGMSLLADSNTISDNCIRLTDVHHNDIEPAVKWLKTYRSMSKE